MPFAFTGHAQEFVVVLEPEKLTEEERNACLRRRQRPRCRSLIRARGRPILYLHSMRSRRLKDRRRLAPEAAAGSSLCGNALIC